MSNPSQIQVTLCSTFLLNNKDFNTILLYVSIGYDIDKQINNYTVLVFNNISLYLHSAKRSYVIILYHYLVLLRSLLLRSSISCIEQI